MVSGRSLRRGWSRLVRGKRRLSGRIKICHTVAPRGNRRLSAAIQHQRHVQRQVVKKRHQPLKKERLPLLDTRIGAACGYRFIERIVDAAAMTERPIGNAKALARPVVLRDFTRR